MKRKPHPPLVEMLEIILRERARGRQVYWFVCGSVGTIPIEENEPDFVPVIRYGRFMGYDPAPTYSIS